MYRPSKALVAALHAKAVAAAQVIAGYRAENLLNARSKYLPAGGAWFIGGHGVGPGVNSTFTQGIAQADLDNLRRGLKLYVFSPAHQLPSHHNHSVLVPGAWVHASATPESDVNDYFSVNPNATLYDINDYLGRSEQAFEQQSNSTFNKDALIAVASFVTAGYAAAADTSVVADTSAAADTGGTATSSEIFGNQVAMTTATADAGGASLTDTALSGAATLGENAAKSTLVNMALAKIAGGQGAQDQPVSVAPVAPVQKSGNVLPLFGAALLALYEFI